MSHNNALPKENEDFEENDVINNASFLDRDADETSEDSKEIYKGSSITLGASMLLIITFALKYSLTGEALNDLLRLIEMHCPPSNFIPQTLGKLKKWFREAKHPLKFHRFCSRCNILLEDANILGGICPNNSCENLLGFGNAVSHFIEIPIKEQIRSFFSRPGFFDDLQHRFTRVKHDASAYEDIYDGEVYKNLSSPGAFLSNPHNISLLWNTDGIPCFKSSKMSIWPLLFQINELPFRKRTSTENMITGGLWFGPSKPAVMSFTRPFIDCLQELERDGVEVT